MNMKSVSVAMFILGLVVGSALGVGFGNGGHTKGRLSACNEIMSVLNRSSGGSLECVVIKGKVLITGPELGGHIFNLDGSELKD